MVIKTTEYLPPISKKRRGEISIEEFRGRLRIRWRYNNRRYSLSAAANTKLNLLIAQKVAIQIEYDIAINDFDYHLIKYRAVIEHSIKPIDNIQEYFPVWVYEMKHKVCSEVDHYYSHHLILKRWGSVTEHNLLKKLKGDTLSNKTFNTRLAVFSSFADWLVRKSLWKYNPLEGMTRKKEDKISDPRRKPFSDEEALNILEAFKSDRFISNRQSVKHSFYYPFIFFLFKTGVRNAEAVGLRVSSVNFSENIITIKEVLARHKFNSHSSSRIRKKTKNGKERNLPLTPDLKDLLEPLCKNKNLDDLVFISPRGHAIDDRKLLKYTFGPILKKLNIPHRILYACRHTFASKCIQSGISPVNTAFLMGNNPETTLRNYTHQIDRPNYLPII